MSQLLRQGIISERLEHLNEFSRVMGDLRIDTHPASQDVKVILTEKTYDVFNDVTHSPKEEITKRALVTKKNVLEYVQALFTELLVENEEQFPYLVTMTTTGLPRVLQADDQIEIDDEIYTVSKVHLGNRSQDTIIRCLVYNERGNIEEEQIDNNEDDDYYSHLNT